MKYVIIVNGKPGSGKTTFSEAIRDYECEGMPVEIVSSIDPIKKIYKEQFGWDGKKNPGTRAALSILKSVWISTCDGPVKYIFNTVYNGGDDTVYLVDVREPEEIAKLVLLFNAMASFGIICRTVLVRRPGADEVTMGNASDDNVEAYPNYDFIVTNDTTIRDFKLLAHMVISKITDNLIDLSPMPEPPQVSNVPQPTEPSAYEPSPISFEDEREMREREIHEREAHEREAREWMTHDAAPEPPEPETPFIDEPHFIPCIDDDLEPCRVPQIPEPESTHCKEYQTPPVIFPVPLDVGDITEDDIFDNNKHIKPDDDQFSDADDL